MRLQNGAMPNLSIKDVPETWTQVLRDRAARHHRSLQGELMAIVESAVRGAAAPGAPLLAGESLSARVVAYDDRGWPTARHGAKTPRQVIAELEKKVTKPARQLSSVKLIRADRDSRLR